MRSLECVVLLLSLLASTAQPLAPRFFDNFFATHTSAPTPVPTPAPIVKLLARLSKIRATAPPRTAAPTPAPLRALPVLPTLEPTPSPSPVHWTMEPTPLPTPAPTPQPTTPRAMCDDTHVTLHGSFVKSSYLGQYNRLRALVHGHPAFKQESGRAEMFLFFTEDAPAEPTFENACVSAGSTRVQCGHLATQHDCSDWSSKLERSVARCQWQEVPVPVEAADHGRGKWAVGPKLGGAPFVLLTERLDNARWPTEITGEWHEIPRMSDVAHDLSTPVVLRVACAPPRTPVPTPNPTPGVRLPDCGTHIMLVETPADDDEENPVKCDDGGLDAGRGRYLQVGHRKFNQRPIYARSNGGKKDKFLFYLGDPFREWVVGPTVGVPPFCLEVKSVATQPHQVEQPWSIYLANATTGAVGAVSQRAIRVICAPDQVPTDDLPPMFTRNWRAAHPIATTTIPPTPVPSPHPTAAPTVAPSPAPTPERCTPGSFRQEVGLETACMLCPLGKYATKWDSPECSTCAGCGPGLEFGGCGPYKKDQCTKCPPGQYNPVDPLSVHATIFRKRCLGCPSGKYQPMSGKSKCTACKWSKTVGSKVCRAACKASCAVGKYLSACKCSNVLLADRSERTPRRLAQFAWHCSGSCALCPPGRTSALSSAGKPQRMEDACLACDTGRHQPVRGGACIACPGCEAGYFRSGCQEDTPGKCEGCEAGRYKPAGGNPVVQCYRCEAGMYQSVGGGAACRRCPADQPLSSPDASVCQRICGSGSYLAETRRCASCPHGKYRMQKAVGSPAVVHGAHFARAAEPNEPCAVCSAGKYSLAGMLGCESCPAVCPLGKFNVGCGKHGLWGRCGKNAPRPQRRKRAKGEQRLAVDGPLMNVHNTWFEAFARSREQHQADEAARRSAEIQRKKEAALVGAADAAAAWSAGGG